MHILGHSAVARQPVLHAILLLAVFFFAGVFAGEASANPSWKLMKGHSTCGGLDANGNLQEPCGMVSAKFEKQANDSCPQGTFLDIGTKGCYSCPAGYKRSAHAVTSPKACDKPVEARNASAKYEGKDDCPSGSFGDPRNGGECWKCPSGYGRTAAAVDAWNACGVIGKQAVGAEFVGRMCDNKGAFRDPRNGGECWSCPEDYQRTAAAVTAPNACRTTLDFEPATKHADRRCEPGQIFDLVDGGTCWSCPAQAKRTVFGVKTAKACALSNMNWVVPQRDRYSLFGLGKGADDILAKMIAERTPIDTMVKAHAKQFKQAEGPLLAAAWEVIDKRPWESTHLKALLAHAVLGAAVKPVAQRTESEKDLLNTTAQLIQWNRQFVANQAKQANDMWIAATTKSHNAALAKMGAAAIYAGGQTPPPDYNELLAASIQSGAAVGGPIGVALFTVLFRPANIALLPFRLAKELAAAGAAAPAASSTALGVAGGPAIIALAVGVIVTMEMDKLMKSEEVAGKIRQALTIADRPVDISVLLQQKDGPDEFMFHWISVLGGSNPGPSATFKTQLAAYKGGATGPLSLSGVKVSGGQVATAEQVQAAVPGQPAATKPATTGVQSAPASPAPTAGQPAAPAGFEMTHVQSKLCLAPQGDKTAAGVPLTLAKCEGARGLRVVQARADGPLEVVGTKLCLEVAGANRAAGAGVALTACAAQPQQAWRLTQEGQVVSGLHGMCAEPPQSAANVPVTMQPCAKGKPSQIWTAR